VNDYILLHHDDASSIDSAPPFGGAEAACAFLVGNPVYEAGEIRELPRD
jgi:hypothetical protein